MLDNQGDATTDLAGRKAKSHQAGDPWVLPLGVVSAAVVFAVVVFG